MAVSHSVAQTNPQYILRTPDKGLIDVILTFSGAHPENQSCILGPEAQSKVSAEDGAASDELSSEEFGISHGFVVKSSQDLYPGLRTAAGDGKHQPSVPLCLLRG